MSSLIAWPRPGCVTNSLEEFLRADWVIGTLSVAATVRLSKQGELGSEYCGNIILIAVIASWQQVSWGRLMTLSLVSLSTHWISVFLTGNITLPADTSSGSKHSTLATSRYSYYGNLLITHVARIHIIVKWFFHAADTIVDFKTGLLDPLTISLISLRPAETIIRSKKMSIETIARKVSL